MLLKFYNNGEEEKYDKRIVKASTKPAFKGFAESRSKIMVISTGVNGIVKDYVKPQKQLKKKNRYAKMGVRLRQGIMTL
jgi:hypothetical protein